MAHLRMEEGVGETHTVRSTVRECSGTPRKSNVLESINFFWIVNFEYPTRLHNGSTLRHVNYSRELVQRGHRVFLGVRFEPQYEEQSRQWFAGLREKGIITDFFELSYAPAQRQLSWAALSLLPSVGNFVLKRFQASTTRSVEELIATLGVDVVLLSDRRLVFLATRLPAAKPLVIDFCDCESLHWARELRQQVRSRQFRATPFALRRFISVLGEDRYYARQGRPLVVVSPVDERALKQIGGRSAQIYTLLNGVTMPSRQTDTEKIKNRLVFSGNMDFSPNYTAALWFLDHVFPLVLEQVPDAQFVIAGANPPPFLRERASSSVVVTGHVEDLNREIARSALYVAPMISGGGFKNKIVEAAVNRTYIVATNLALEFLEPSVRELIAVADTAPEMAGAIVTLLRDPAGCASRSLALYEHVSQSFAWSRRAEELVEIARTCITQVRGAQ
jgi:glycosyltransferase involved in cell wall biosynthesis